MMILLYLWAAMGILTFIIRYHQTELEMPAFLIFSICVAMGLLGLIMILFQIYIIHGRIDALDDLNED